MSLVDYHLDDPITRKAAYDNLLQQPYNPRAKGGIKTHLKEFQFNLLQRNKMELFMANASRREANIPRDADSLEKLLIGLDQEPSMRSITRDIRQDGSYTLNGAIKYIKQQASRYDFLDEMRTRTRQRGTAFLLDTEEQEHSNRQALLVDQDPVLTQIEALLQQRLPQEYRLSNDLYQCIPQEARAEFRRMRNGLITNKNSADKTPPGNEIPRQYDKKQASGKDTTLNALNASRSTPPEVEATEQQSGTPDPMEEDSITADDNVMTAMLVNLQNQRDQVLSLNTQYRHDSHFVNMHSVVHEPDAVAYADDIQFRQPMKIEQRYYNLKMDCGDGTFLMIVDGGANSFLLSTKSWHIEDIVPNRRAIISGCKDSYVDKGNPIGTGLTILESSKPNGRTIALRVHEGAIHDDKITLMSTFQAREHGIIVDDTPKTHKRDHDGNYGLKCVCIIQVCYIVLILL